MIAPIAVFAVGNPARGDDGVGLLLAERLERAARPGVELVVDHQLQVEHALALSGRSSVLFIDAAVGLDEPFQLSRLKVPVDRSCAFSHALEPADVIATFRQIDAGQCPDAWVLAVRTRHFELGTDIDPATRGDADAAWAALVAFLDGKGTP